MSPTCGCCSPNAPLTPVAVSNRPGLSAIAYRIGTYAGFRETMLDAIARTPQLAALSTRLSDDYSVTFIELWAALLDVLTFYQERYANEVFLRSAQQMVSLQRLARLLDYSPRPGVAAIANLAFTLDPDATVQIPVGLRVQSVPAQNQQPQMFETIEAVAADARFNRLRMRPKPSLNAPLQPGSTTEILDRMGGPGYLAALAVNDPVVLFNDGGSDAPEEKKISALTVADDTVALAWTKPVQGQNWSAGSKAFKYRRTFRLFGFNAPSTFMQPTSSNSVPGGILWSQQRTDFTNPGGTTLNLDSRYSDLATGTQLLVVFPPQPPPPPPTPTPTPIPFPIPIVLGGGIHNLVEKFPLLTLQSSLQAVSGNQAILGVLHLGNVLNLLPAGVQTNLVTVTQVSQVPVTTPVQNQSGGAPGAMSDTVTQVTIDTGLPAIQDIRSAMVFELVGGQILFWGSVYPAAINTPAAYLPGRFVLNGSTMAIEVGRTIQNNAFVPGVVIAPEDLDVGRSLILADAQDQPVEASVQGPPQFDTAGPSPGAFGHLVIPLQAGAFSLDSDTAVLLGNVVQASNGQTVSNETLGSGNAAQTFQTFTLQKQPLTYVPGSGPGGVNSSLAVSVNQVQWSEVQDIYGQAPTAQVFSTRASDSGQTLVQGGDSVYGAVFPTGTANITATYRFGSGIAGNVNAGQLTTLLDRLPGLTSVTNPLPAEGGADPAAPDDVRQGAPLTVRTFNRAVSLLDFQDLITASGEVAKAIATWVWDGYAPAVHLTVAGQNGEAFSDLSGLGATLANERDPNYRLLIANYSEVPILLSAKVWVNPAYSTASVLAAATQAALAAMSFDALDLAESVHLSAIYAVLQSVPGVVGADVTRFGFKIPAGQDPITYLQSRGVTWLAGGVVAPVQDFLRIFPARPDPNNPGSVLPAEMAAIATPSQDVIIAVEGS